MGVVAVLEGAMGAGRSMTNGCTPLGLDIEQWLA